MDNKHYRYGDPVEISALHFAVSENPDKLLYGIVVGKISEHVIDFWMVELEEFIPNWEYKVVSVASSLMRPRGSKEEFLCKQVIGDRS